MAHSTTEGKTGQTTRIRLANLDDLECVQKCASAAYSKYIERMGREPAPMLVDFSEQIRAGFVYVSLNYSVLSGYVVFYPAEEGLHLESVAVHPSHRGQGIGKILVEFVEQAARDQGLDSVELYTNEAMTENLTLYSKLGYTEVARHQQDGFNRVFFRKHLS